MGVNSLPKTVTRQSLGCDLNPGPAAPESSTLTTRLPSHPNTANTPAELRPRPSDPEVRWNDPRMFCGRAVRASRRVDIINACCGACGV